MLRARQLAPGLYRGLRTSSVRVEAAKPEVVQNLAQNGPVKPKRRTVRNFFLVTTVVGAALYGTGVWYALSDDRFEGLFTAYVPFADATVGYFEEQRFRAQVRKLGEDRTRDTSPAPYLSSPSKEDVVVKVPASGVQASDVKVKDAKTVHEDAKAKVEDQTGSKPKKAAAPKPSAPSSVASALPLIRVSQDDEAIVNAVNALNTFIEQVNSSSPDEKAVQAVSKELTKLSQAVAALRLKHRDELKQALDEQARKFAELAETQKDAVTKTLEERTAEFEQGVRALRSQAQAVYNARLLTEIEATKQAVVAEANNRIVALVAYQNEQLAQTVAQQVETEREGRLGRLQELSTDLEQLQSTVATSDRILDRAEKIAQLQTAVGALTRALSLAEPVDVSLYVEKIKQLTSAEDPLVAAVLAALPDTSSGGVLTHAQLAARFRNLMPELRKASLLPANAGVAGHAASIVFSQLLWPKAGTAEGSDVESVIARAEAALTEGRLLDAVSEVNGLQGWPRRLAQDWLEEGRRRGEVELAAALLRDHAVVLGKFDA